jgi:membrane protein DedA with SNARE-associated domain
MKANAMANKGIYVGTGIGLIMFVLIGLFPGSLIGGAIGLQISSFLFGGPVQAALLPRLIVAVSMLAGIMGSAMFFIVSGSLGGWAIGTIADAVSGTESVEATEAHQAIK